MLLSFTIFNKFFLFFLFCICAFCFSWLYKIHDRKLSKLANPMELNFVFMVFSQEKFEDLYVFIPPE